jgi:flagellar protein FliS
MSSDASNLYKAYHKATHTVSKTRQVVMLYDGAVRFLQQASEAIENKEIERRYNTLTRASEILSGLQSCLDFDSAEGMARVLFDFYTNIDLRILALHRTPDKADCDQIIAELKQMRDVWDLIDRGGEAKPVANEPVSVPSADSNNAAVSA